MQTIIEKSKSRGWQAKTIWDLGGDFPRGEMELTISTYAYNGAIRTNASIGFARDGFVHHYLGQDFSRLILSRPIASRVTEKAITLQHNEALRDIEAIAERAKCHYGPVSFAVEA